MRVTNEMVVANSLSRLQSRLSRYERVQSQLSLGKTMLAPSDDPGATARALSLRSTIRSREQELRNAGDARSWLDIADTQLQTSVTRLQRARDLAVRGASDTDPSERRAIAIELRSIADELVGIANTRHDGRPLFAGTSSGTAVTATAGGPPFTYAGDDHAVTRRIGDDELTRINVDARRAFGFADGDDVFTLLHELAGAIEAGDRTAASQGLTRMDAARTRITDALADVGTARNRVDGAQQRTVDVLLALRTELAQLEDVDLAEAIMNLQVEQVAYEATLQALARALPPSLASFLR